MSRRNSSRKSELDTLAARISHLNTASTRYHALHGGPSALEFSVTWGHRMGCTETFELYPRGRIAIMPALFRWQNKSAGVYEFSGYTEIGSGLSELFPHSSLVRGLYCHRTKMGWVTASQLISEDLQKTIASAILSAGMHLWPSGLIDFKEEVRVTHSATLWYDRSDTHSDLRNLIPEIGETSVDIIRSWIRQNPDNALTWYEMMQRFNPGLFASKKA